MNESLESSNKPSAISVHAWHSSPQYQRDSKRYMLQAVKYTSLRFLTKEQLQEMLEDISCRSGTEREKPEDWEDAQMIRHKLNSMATIEKLEEALRQAHAHEEVAPSTGISLNLSEIIKSRLFQQKTPPLTPPTP